VGVVGEKREEGLKKKELERKGRRSRIILNLFSPLSFTYIESELVGKDRVAAGRLLRGGPHDSGAQREANQDLGAPHEPALFIWSMIVCVLLCVSLVCMCVYVSVYAYIKCDSVAAAPTLSSCLPPSLPTFDEYPNKLSPSTVKIPLWPPPILSIDRNDPAFFAAMPAPLSPPSSSLSSSAHMEAVARSSSSSAMSSAADSSSERGEGGRKGRREGGEGAESE